MSTAAKADATARKDDSEREETAERIKAKADAEGGDKKEEKKEERADDSRGDADAGVKLDKMLTHLDGFSKRFDAMERRMDACETGMRKDAAGDDKDKEVITDKRKDDDKKEEKEKRDDAARADAAKSADAIVLRERLESLERRMKPLTDDDRKTFADIQSRADSVFSQMGEHAPRHMDGESPFDYRRRLIGKLQSHSPRWKEIDTAVFKDDESGRKGIAVMEDQVFADAVEAARKPIGLPPGQLVERKTTNPATGGVVITFHSSGSSFVSSMSRPPSYVTRIGTPRPGID